MKATHALGKLYKSYLFTVVAKDLKKLAEMDIKRHLRKTMKNMDFDKKILLRRVGLAPYRPVRNTLGTGLVFLVGATLGTIAGMVLTPFKGEDFRRQLKGRATSLMGRTDLGETQAPAEA